MADSAGHQRNLQVIEQLVVAMIPAEVRDPVRRVVLEARRDFGARSG